MPPAPLPRARNQSLPDDARCLNCGYRLYTNESGVCPECGRLFYSHDPTTFRIGEKLGSWRALARPPTWFECVVIFVFGFLSLLGASAPPELYDWLFSLSMCGGVIWAPIVIAYFCRLAAWFADRGRSGNPVSANPLKWRREWWMVPIFLGMLVSFHFYPWPLALRFQLSRDAFERAAKDVQAGTFHTPKWVGLYRVTSFTLNANEIDFITGESFIDPAGFRHSPNGPWIHYGTRAWGMSVAQGWYTVEH